MIASPMPLASGFAICVSYATEIDADQDEARHGIGWWMLPMKQRVLIGDYLLDCIRAMEVNLIEAQLHHWEVLDWSDKVETIANFRGSAIMGDAGTTVEIPRFPMGESGTSDRAKRGWFSAQAPDRFHPQRMQREVEFLDSLPLHRDELE
jgi:hypothetical protein